MARRNNPVTMRKWVEALRSGDYQQGNGSLLMHVDDTKEYCCLGVACDVAIKEGLEGIREATDDEAPGFITSGSVFSENGDLPNLVSNWLGLDMSDPYIAWDDEKDEPISASMANDALGWNFDQIADAIEERYELTAEG